MMSGGREKSSAQRRIRAVVADDFSDWRPVISELLKVEDYVEMVARVDHGQQAIEAVSVFKADLLIIDLGIGLIDGLTTTELLCQQFPSLVVILVTRMETPRLRTVCQSSGAKYFIQKTRFHEDWPQVLVEIKNSLLIS